MLGLLKQGNPERVLIENNFGTTSVSHAGLEIKKKSGRKFVTCYENLVATFKILF